MASYSVAVYAGTAKASVLEAANQIKTWLQTISTGSTIRGGPNIQDVGPGRYFIPWLIADA